MTFLLRPTRQAVGRLLCLSGLALSAVVFPQTPSWPDRPIRIVVPAGAGSAGDNTIRKISIELAKALGQAVVVENRPGAAGRLAAGEVARAAGDGYTFLYADSGVMLLLPLTGGKTSYDPEKDFLPVVRVNYVYPYIAVPAASSIFKLADFKNLGRNPTMGVTGMGGVSHAASLSLGRAHGVDFSLVPYSQGGMAVILDVAKGTTDASMSYASEAKGLIASGKVRFIATLAPTRNPMFPDVPSVDEFASPGGGLATWTALFAPTSTPQPMVERMRTEINKVLLGDVFQAFYGALGVPIEVLDGPGFAKFYSEQRLHLKKIVDTYGLKSE
jgi:tripartite-type tricarboxylate transporter receptor subunit TctC